MTKKKKVVIDELIEQEKELTMKEWLQIKINDTFIEYIPLDTIKQMPTNYKYIFGSFAHIFSFTVLIGFLIWGYQQATHRTFMSLHKSDGVCEEIPVSITGTYRADTNGYWEGSNTFSAPLAPYYLNLINFQADTSLYRSLLENVRHELENIGRLAKTQDLMTNLLYWMMWSYQLPYTGSANYFLMTGTPNHVFNRLYYYGTISNVEGECNVGQVVSLSLPDVFIVYNVGLMVTQPCKSAIVPTNLGYVPFYQGTTFTVKLDLIAATIANAINNGVLNPLFLKYVTGSQSYENYRGNTIKYSQRFFDRYPGHAPVFCLEYEDITKCVLQIGTTYVLPVMRHYGTGDQPIPCDCSNSTSFTSHCNVFDLMVGLIFYNTDMEASMYSLIDLVLKYRNPFEIDNVAYDALFIASQYGDITDKNRREEAYNFCYSETYNVNCSLFLYNFFDEYSSTVSESYYQLPYGACNDSFTISRTNWEKLEKNPPIKLQQDYYECTQTWMNAVINSMGIASGNAGIIVPLGLLCIMPIMYLILKMDRVTPLKDEYSEEEIMNTNKALAVVLLRIRDGKVRGVSEGATLRNIVKELVKAANSDGGYPDSDDESDDDDDDKDGNELNKNKKNENIPPIKPRRQSATSVFIKKERGSIPQIEKKGSTQEIDIELATSQNKLHENSIQSLSKGELLILNPLEKNPQRRNHTPFSITTPETESQLESFLSVLENELLDAMKHKDNETKFTSIMKSVNHKTTFLREIKIWNLIESQTSISPECKAFLSLYNIALFHASLILNCDIPYVNIDSVGYSIGGRVITAREMRLIGFGEIIVSENIGVIEPK